MKYVLLEYCTRFMIVSIEIHISKPYNNILFIATSFSNNIGHTLFKNFVNLHLLYIYFSICCYDGFMVELT